MPVFGLQQTVGELTSNISAGNSSVLKYGIMNDDNYTVIVKLNVTGTVSDFVEYPAELKLEPGQFVYVQLKVNIPSDYSGKSELTGIVYALQEGKTDGQIQVNTQLAKKVTVNINSIDSKLNVYVAGIILVIILIIAGILLNSARRK